MFSLTMRNLVRIYILRKSLREISVNVIHGKHKYAFAITFLISKEQSYDFQFSYYYSSVQVLTCLDKLWKSCVWFSVVQTLHLKTVVKVLRSWFVEICKKIYHKYDRYTRINKPITWMNSLNSPSKTLYYHNCVI